MPTVNITFIFTSEPMHTYDYLRNKAASKYFSLNLKID